MITVFIDELDVKEFYELTLEQFDIGIPEPKLTTVSIPGRDGELDMSTALTGYLHYHNRIITLQLGAIGSDEACEFTRINFMKAVQGRVLRIHFSHLEGYFKGRGLIEKVTREKQHYTLFLKVVCEPYRYLPEHYEELTLTSSLKKLNFNTGMMPVAPVIKTTGSATIIFKEKQYSVSAGEHRLGIVFSGSRNALSVSGTGKMVITHAVGVL